MPIENIKDSQYQSRIFERGLSEELERSHKLYKLRNLINFDELEEKIRKLIKEKKLGRTKTSTRVLIGLGLLQAMYNTSDALTSETFEENVYWQYFCGYEYAIKGKSVSESVIRRFRQTLGEEGYNIMLCELLRVGLKVGACKKKDMASVIIDTTVQIKNIKHPHDGNLLSKAREEIVNLAHELGIPLKSTYAKQYKIGLLKLWKYKGDSQSKKRRKVMKRLKTIVGRVIRVVERTIAALEIQLNEVQKSIFGRVKAIYRQSFLGSNEKRKYKEAGNKVLYSFHATEVECIGKGKLSKPYEFGNKVGIAVSGRGNFVLGIKSFQGNPYDGHTLKQTIEEVEENSGIGIEKAFVDLGYRGNNYEQKGKIYTPYTRKRLNKKDKAMQKRRSAIEPIIGHLKHYGRMGRNYLKGVMGDIINPIISAIGLNLRCIANKISGIAY